MVVLTCVNFHALSTRFLTVCCKCCGVVTGVRKSWKAKAAMSWNVIILLMEPNEAQIWYPSCILRTLSSTFTDQHSDIWGYFWRMSLCTQTEQPA